MTEQSWPIDSISPKNEQGGYGVKLRGFNSVLRFTAETLEAVGVTPPPDLIDFDTVPNGTLLRYKDGDVRHKREDRWFDQYGDEKWPRNELAADYTVVHIPASEDQIITAFMNWLEDYSDLNDEGIYFTFHSVGTGRFRGTAAELREFFSDNPIGIDLDLVDWDQVVESLEEESWRDE